MLSKSGYGVHSRQLLRYLLGKTGINVTAQVVPWGVTPWDINPEAYGGLVGEIVKRSATDPNKKYDVSFQVILPNEWDASLAEYNIGVTAGVETDRCNPMWTTVHCSKMDKIIVPSQHTKDSFIKSARSSTEIRVVPESYFEELLDEPSDLELELSTDFNFLAIGVMTGMTPETDRKNLFYLLKWFVEEFKNDKDVGLIVKTNRGREHAIDKVNTQVLLSRVLKEVGHKGTPRIYLLHGDMERQEMNSLYKHPDVKALVSVTRGEGFGLPLLEASVAGLPVIATEWSSHVEFLNFGKWVKLDYELCEVHQSRVDNNIFVPGAKWAEVKEESFKRAIRKFRKSHAVPKAWAQDLSNKLSERYSHKKICMLYEEVLGPILS